MKRQIKVTGICLEEFMEILANVYGSGADYADLIVIQEGNQSTVRIEVKEEYMSDMKEEEQGEMKITNETLKGLIDG